MAGGCLRVLPAVLCLSQALFISCACKFTSTPPISSISLSAVQSSCSSSNSSSVFFTLLSPSDSSSLSFLSEPVSVVQKQGGEVQLLCSVRPASARLWWLFRGQPLEQGALKGVELQPGSLAIPSLQPEHQGSYQCLAQSEAGVIISRYAHVEIAGIHTCAAHPNTLVYKDTHTSIKNAKTYAKTYSLKGEYVNHRSG